ncbi:MAG: SIR2 family protein [Actinomycetota bacterium]|nr:MAG: SIR2 family protein [Actinomycetota bacterium]
MSTADAATALDALVADGVQRVTLEEFSTTWAVQRQRFAWLLGAGASASAGVPLASSIRDRLLFDRYAAVQQLVRQDLDETDPALVERVHTFFDDANGMPPLGSAGDYSAAFALCLPEPSARKALLQQLIEGAKPGFAQRVFGGLIVSGACDLVITTNFDRLVEKSFAEAQRAGTDLNQDLGRELNVAGLDSTARATTALQNRQWPLVLNLHGDFREKRLMNTDDELRTQEAGLRRFVVGASRQFGLVVSGYSGRDESVMDMLIEAATLPDGWPHGIWWLIRPHESPVPGVETLLRAAAANNVSTTLVIAPSFDETMTALSRQVTVDQAMREYFNRLHPKPRSVPAALPTNRQNWPVLRFNALPLLEASVTVTRVVIPSAWRRGEVRRAFHPTDEWPIVVSGPGEVLCLGKPEAALDCLRADPNLADRGTPGPAEEVELDLLAPDAPRHHHNLMLQLLARAVAEVAPVRMRVARGGSPNLLLEGTLEGEPAGFQRIRTGMNRAYEGSLFGYLDAKYGQTDRGGDRRWAEMVILSFDRRAGRDWLLFRPWTWIAPLSKRETEADDPRRRDELDPAGPWRSEVWAKRRRNETWAGLIAAWSALLAPAERTELTINSEVGAPMGRIVLSHTNAYSRPA